MEISVYNLNPRVSQIDLSKGYKGITCFIGTKDMGIEIAKKEQKLGIRASSTCTLNFDDVKVKFFVSHSLLRLLISMAILQIPAENIIGGEGQGYKVRHLFHVRHLDMLMARRLPLKSSTRVGRSHSPVSSLPLPKLIFFFTGRIGIAAQMLGLAQGAFSLSVPYTYTRNQFKQPIGTFQGMAFSFADAATQIETAKLLTYNAARRKEAGLSFVKEAAMAKWWASKVAQEVSGNAIEWMGGLGFTRETGVEKFWRDSKIVRSDRYGWVCILTRTTFMSFSSRVQYMKGHQISSYRQLPSSFRRSIRLDGL